ncbi:sec-independent protein translocase protein TatC [Natronincola peptidivorans]|uniref:Sec-independent protein translocase protein TatC n=2 Tax=Natronincola peptidivorans TaxID=426128 RepID=A0A1I0BKQ2_9FIRM|nr:sec-independent protein translocase protein TatC [Natronincola peptidivorans]
MSVIHHLEELRKRLIICLVALLLTSVISFMFVEEIRYLLIRPAGSLELIYISPPEALMANIRLAILAGIILAMPILIYQFLAFIMPALYKSEKKLLIPIVFGMLVMFSVGIAFAYTIAFPFAITFFLQFASQDVIPMFTITQYISFVTQFLLTFGLVFQLPLFFLILGTMNIVTAPLLRRIRKYVVVAIAIGAAIITPPDIISQLMIAAPLLVLYEIGILLVAVIQFRKKRKKKDS